MRAAIDQLADDTARQIEEARAALPPLTSAAPALLRFAHHRANQVVDHVPRYSSEDHAALFQALLRMLAPAPETEFVPAMDPLSESHPSVRRCFDLEADRAWLRQFAVSLDEGYWQIDTVDETPRIRLTAPMRRSALHLLANKAEFVDLEPSLRRLVERGADADPIKVTLRAGLRELRMLEQCAPEAWKQFIGSLPFRIDAVPDFRAFALSLSAGRAKWFPASELWNRWRSFAAAYGRPKRSVDEFQALLDFYSVTPGEGLRWGVQAPFIRLGAWYGQWFFAFHVLHPDLGLLAILIRRREELWSHTLGAQLKNAAPWLARQLPVYDRVRVATLRNGPRGGDADLALWDLESRHVVICEVKSVFDKFRTNHQLRNFTQQKVNFQRALGQLERSAGAIADGTWPLETLFGADVVGPPARVTPLLLTWWDQINPTLGQDGPATATVNFNVFRYLFKAARGDLDAMVVAAEELGRVYCVPRIMPGRLSLPDGDLTFRKEVQTDGLPPLSALPTTLGPLARQEIETLPHFPEDWRAQIPQGEEYELY